MASSENNESIRSLIKEFLDVFDADRLESYIRSRANDPLSLGCTFDQRYMRGERENLSKNSNFFWIDFLSPEWTMLKVGIWDALGYVEHGGKPSPAKYLAMASTRRPRRRTRPKTPPSRYET